MKIQLRLPLMQSGSALTFYHKDESCKTGNNIFELLKQRKDGLFLILRSHDESKEKKIPLQIESILKMQNNQYTNSHAHYTIVNANIHAKIGFDKEYPREFILCEPPLGDLDTVYVYYREMI